MATETNLSTPLPKNAASAETSPARWSLRGHVLAELGWLAAAMLASLLVACWVLRIWDAQLHVPMALSGDGLLSVVGFKGLIEQGWYFVNPALGAPAGLKTYDFSAFDADNVQWAVIRLIAFGTSDASAALNVYYLIGYPMVAGATFLVLRALGTARATAFAGAVIFAALPYHFSRSEGHLFLANYFAVPLGGWLVLRTLLGEPLLQARAGVLGRTRWLSPVSVLTTAAVFLVAGATLYYAVFTMLLTGMAAVLRVLITRRLRAIAPGLLVAATVGVMVLVNISPGLVYQHEHGRNPVVARRALIESEIYSTSLTQMVLPIPGHRIHAFARVAQTHVSSTLAPSEPGTQLGLLLSISFVALLLSLVVRGVRGPGPGTPESRLIGACAIAAAMGFFIATFGGISDLIAQFVSPQIRAWNRITPFIAFFGLVAFVIVADRAIGRLRGHVRGRRGRVLATAALAVVTLLAVLDQTSVTSVPSYRANLATWRSDGRFVAAIERQVPRGAMILQLPFHGFPEVAGTGTMADYDLFRGYVHSSHLRWSYGAIKGRPEDWSDEASTRSLSFVIPAAIAAGFSGVYVDRHGYDDGGAAIQPRLDRLLGVSGPRVTSSDGRLVYFDGGPLAQRMSAVPPPARKRLSDALIHPLVITHDIGIGPQESGGGRRWNWAGPDGSFTVRNPGAQARPVVFATTAAAGPTSVLHLEVPGQPVRAIPFTRAERRLRVRFLAPPGNSTISLHTDGPDLGPDDPRDLRVQLFSLRVVEDTPIPAVMRPRSTG